MQRSTRTLNVTLFTEEAEEYLGVVWHSTIAPHVLDEGSASRKNADFVPSDACQYRFALSWLDVCHTILTILCS